MNKYKIKGIKYAFGGFLLASTFFSCSKDYDTDYHTDGQANVYISQALGLSENATFTYSSTASTLKLTATSGAKATQDIKVTFATDPSLVASFDTSNPSKYVKLPDGCVEIPSPVATIPAGEYISNELEVKVKTTGVLDRSTTYLLPVIISKVDGGTLNEAMSVKYYVVTAVYEDLDKTGWTIQGFDSEEATGEGPNNGRAVFILDNNVSTIWHTQWDGGTPPLPHWVSVDMQSAKLISGLSFVNRQGASNGIPKNIKVQVSTDGTTWTDAGNYVLVQGNAKQFIYFPTPMSARYFKVTATSSYGDTPYIFMAEMGAI